ncbi:MAG: hypothetical protein JWO08_3970 [Verrucomicrobiaceae bacterium]|nr:hypothetical protein [Verrucomicrobiaceae bacterium]
MRLSGSRQSTPEISGRVDMPGRDGPWLSFELEIKVGPSFAQRLHSLDRACSGHFAASAKQQKTGHEVTGYFDGMH